VSVLLQRALLKGFTQAQQDTNDTAPNLQVEAVIPQVQLVGGGPWFTDQFDNVAVDRRGAFYATGYLPNPTTERPDLHPLANVGDYDPASGWSGLRLRYPDPNARLQGVGFVKARQGQNGGRVLLADAASKQRFDINWTGDANPPPQGILDRNPNLNQTTLCNGFGSVDMQDMAVTPNGRFVYVASRCSLSNSA
jgi:hypothetical protein